jgi:hypothetical protein
MRNLLVTYNILCQQSQHPQNLLSVGENPPFGGYEARRPHAINTTGAIRWGSPGYKEVVPMRRILLVLVVLALLVVPAVPAMAQSWWDDDRGHHSNNNWWDNDRDDDRDDDRGDRDRDHNRWDNNNVWCGWYPSWWGWHYWCYSPWWGWWLVW